MQEHTRAYTYKYHLVLRSTEMKFFTLFPDDVGRVEGRRPSSVHPRLNHNRDFNGPQIKSHIHLNPHVIWSLRDVLPLTLLP
jgi:hypothetical protein